RSCAASAAAFPGATADSGRRPSRRPDGPRPAGSGRRRRGRRRARRRRLRDRARRRRRCPPPPRPRRRQATGPPLRRGPAVAPPPAAPGGGTPLAPPFHEAGGYASHDGGSIYTMSRGKGAPILFSHGVTLSTRVWVKQFESLPEQRFRCIGFDHRGHGDSECGDSGHSIANLAEDVRTVLERMDLHDAILVGHSMGGIALQAFATRHPDVAAERVRGMVLISTLAKTYLSGSSWLRKMFERLTGGGPSAGELMTQQNLGFFLTRVGFGRDPQASHVELVRQMIAACPKPASQEAVAARVGLDMTEELPTTRVPTRGPSR